MNAEGKRLAEARERTAHWRRWGPYLSERQWGTVREDYSPDGAAWDYLPHEHARSRAYRWGEDGLLGISDNHQRLCFAVALWNEKDPILKERLFGLSGSQGNHGEDVKEYYFYLDSTPTHSYIKGLYKYPQAAFPYGSLVEENARRSRSQPEFELLDTGVFIESYLPKFWRRMKWFIRNRPELRHHIIPQERPDGKTRRLLSLTNGERLTRVLRYMLDENEFLSPYGIRSLSRYHRERPYVLSANGQEYRVDYEPAESITDLFGGNSNWRGPIWFPVNFLLIESLQKFDHFYGGSFQVEYPTGSRNALSLWDVAAELSRRLTHIFLRGPDGRRPVYGGTRKFQTDPHWRDLILFHEYFHADDGAGIGASHQTGWTGLVAKLLQQSGE